MIERGRIGRMAGVSALVVVVLLLLVVGPQETRGQDALFNLCKAYSDEKVSLDDLYSVLRAVKSGQCAEAFNVLLTFSLNERELEAVAIEAGFSGREGKALLFVQEKGKVVQPLGAGALLVYGHLGTFPLKENDRLHIFAAGSTAFPDVVIEVSLSCDVYDDVCDELCSYLPGIYDGECYRDGLKEDVRCDLDAVDRNQDQKITAEDKDGVCDLDCYNNKREGYYDPDCPSTNVDGIWEPDANGIKDGTCDPDLGARNFLCDPDCDGETGTGNPDGLKDDDCFVCDGTCNNYCSPACTELDYPDADPDCKRKEDVTFYCSGDGFCDNSRGESCADSEDCPGSGTCSDLGGVCCPGSGVSDEYGCTKAVGFVEGDQCACTNQCGDGSGQEKCSDTTDDFEDFPKACCPPGYKWNGTACFRDKKFVILYLAIGNRISNFEAVAQTGTDAWEQISPLRACPGVVEQIVEADRVCNVNAGKPGQAIPGLRRCAANFGYRGQYDRIVGVSSRRCLVRMRGGCVLGYTNIGIEVTVTVLSNIVSTTTHELGHTFGLCDEGYGGGPCSTASCSSGYCGGGGAGCTPGAYCCPNPPQMNSIHCSANLCGRSCSYAPQFAPISYSYLETQLKEWCPGS